MAQVQRTNRDWLIAAGVFAVALAVRLIFLFSSSDRDWPHSIWYEGDAPLWVEYAAALDKGEPFEFNVPLHPPGVAYPLKWLYPGVHEKGFVGAKVLLCAMSAAACGLLYLCCVPMGRRVALIAATLCTFSFGQYITATSLNTEAPYTMLLCAVVLLTQHAVNGRSMRWMIALGAIHGIANLIRPEHTMLVAFWAVWMFFHIRRQQKWEPVLRSQGAPSASTVALCGAMVVAFLLICLPWSLRASMNVRTFNRASVAHAVPSDVTPPWTDAAKVRLAQLPAVMQEDNSEFITHIAAKEGLATVDASDIDRILMEKFGTVPKPLSSIVLVCNQGGMSFALSNHPDSNGGFSRAALANEMVGTNSTFRFTFPPHWRLLTDGYRVGWGYIAKDPQRWLKLVGRKLIRFSNGATLGFTAANLPAGRSGVREPVDLFVPASPVSSAWRLCFLGMVIAGAAVACNRRVAGIWLLIIGYKLIVTILFYGYARQAVSIAPTFFVLVALPIDAIVAGLNQRLQERVGWLGIALVVAAIGVDVTMSVRRPPLMASGPFMEAAPRWASAAFESFGRVEIKPDPAAP